MKSIFIKIKYPVEVIKGFFRFWLVPFPKIFLVNLKKVETIHVHVGGGVEFRRDNQNNSLSFWLGYSEKGMNRAYELEEQIINKLNKNSIKWEWSKEGPIKLI